MEDGARGSFSGRLSSFVRLHCDGGPSEVTDIGGEDLAGEVTGCARLGRDGRPCETIGIGGEDFAGEVTGCRYPGRESCGAGHVARLSSSIYVRPSPLRCSSKVLELPLSSRSCTSCMY